MLKPIMSLTTWTEHGLIMLLLGVDVEFVNAF